MSAARTRLDAGACADFVPGVVRVVTLPPGHCDGGRRTALVVCDQRGALHAFVNRCRHLPIPLDAGSGEFLSADGAHFECRTHGARYRLHDGRCVQGPCDGRALEALALELERGRVYLVLDA